MLNEDLSWNGFLVYFGIFSSNLGDISIFEAELLGFIIARELAASNHWGSLWIEGDSSSVLLAFKKPELVPCILGNRWHPCFTLGLQVLSSHIFGGMLCLISLGKISLGTNMACQIIVFHNFG